MIELGREESIALTIKIDSEDLTLVKNASYKSSSMITSAEVVVGCWNVWFLFIYGSSSIGEVNIQY